MMTTPLYRQRVYRDGVTTRRAPTEEISTVSVAAGRFKTGPHSKKSRFVSRFIYRPKQNPLKP